MAKATMKERLLLTGVAGGIGCHVVRHVMENTDWDLVGIDSFRHKGWPDRVINAVQDHPEWKDRIEIFAYDLNAPFSSVFIKKLGRIDYIINMASLSDVEDSITDPVPFIQNNVNLVLNVLEYARVAQPGVFIQISTDEVYGPIENKTDKGMKEWDPFVPSNPYSASKLAQEAIATSYWRTYNVPLIITNTMNNFGEMQSASKYPSMVIDWLLRGEKITVHGTKHEDGTAEIGSRSYIHSRNFADALVWLIKNAPPHMHVPDSVDMPDRYNIAGDLQLDNLELAKKIAEAMGRRDVQYEVVNVHTLRPGHDRHYGLDNTKLKELGWKSPLTFDESLKNTVEWYIKNPDWL
uniref:Putative GDP-mannose 4,6-dehydratase n=1 Tax=viral metagenome TaxID=1070528 RepID=A0A6M3J6V6_9ZZZZ